MKKERFGIILPITLLSYFLILMDNSIIFTSSTQIGESLGLNQTSLSWVSNAYTLTFGGFLLLAGRLSDLLGRKKIFQIGLFIFGISSLIIGLAQSSFIIILARAIQGIGSSIIAPTTLALIMDAYKGDMRRRAIAYYGATAGIGSSVGLLIGGALTSFISWRAGFLVNIPIVILLIILAKNNIQTTKISAQKIDYVGSILSVIGLASFIYGLSRGSSKIFIIIGVVILIVFYLYERKVETPIMPLSLWKNRVRFSAYIVRGLFMMAMLSYWFLLPQSLQKVYGYSALEAGMAFLPLSIMTFITALFLPKLMNYFSNSKILLFGTIVLTIGLLLSSLIPLNKGYILAVGIPMIIIGIGQALITAPVTTAGIHKASGELAGTASGITNAMHQLGGPIGLSLIISTTDKLNISILIMTGFIAIAALLVWVFMVKQG